MKLFDKAEWATHVANDLDTNTGPGYFSMTSYKANRSLTKTEGGGSSELQKFPFFLPGWSPGPWLAEEGCPGLYFTLSLSPLAQSSGWCAGVIRITKRLTRLLFTQLSHCHTVSPYVTNKKYTPVTTQPPSWTLKKISRKLFDLCGAMGSSHIMTQMVVDIFRPKYLHPLAVKNDW